MAELLRLNMEGCFMAPIRLVLLIAAFICCVLAAIGVSGGPRLNLFPLGVALWLLGQLV